MKLGLVVPCVILSIALGAMPHAQTQVSDRNVKAAFLVRFADFVTWPPEVQAQPFTVCLSPSHDFGQAVATTARGTMVRGRQMGVRQLRQGDSVADCQLLYVAPADEHLLPLTRRRPILTVGEGQGFCQRGGAINLRVVDDRVRFEVSLTQAKAVGLSVNSQLLRLAVAVQEGASETLVPRATHPSQARDHVDDQDDRGPVDHDDRAREHGGRSGPPGAGL